MTLALFVHAHPGTPNLKAAGTLEGVKSRTAVCALAGLLLLATGAAASAQTAPGAHVRPDGHILLAWLNGGTSADYQLQVEHLPGVTVVAPTWWSLDPSDPGAVTDAADPRFVAWAGERDVAVWPQLGNRLDADLSEAVLSDAGRRSRLVTSTTAAVERSGAGGILVGFENLRARTGPALTAFVHELRTALPGRIVAVTVAPVTDTWSRGDWSAAYERRPLGEAADYIVLAALDEHDDATGPGPVAGIDWTRAAIERLLSSVPDRKIVLAVPLYTRTWVGGPGAQDGGRLEATLGMDAMAQRLGETGVAHEFDSSAGQRRYTATTPDGQVRTTWQEDNASLARRAELATAYNLGGVAGWRAGFAGPEAWSTISTVLAANPRPPGSASGPPRINRLVPLPQVAGPSPQAVAGEDRELLAPSAPARSDPTVLPVVAAALLVVFAGGLLLGLRVQRSSRSKASSAFSSPPTSIDMPER